MDFTDKKSFFCNNCGRTGHSNKNCNDAVTSCGVILIQFHMDDKHKDRLIEKFTKSSRTNISTESGIGIDELRDVEIFSQYKNCVKFLLIRRKHTLGFTEFMRGRYKIDDADGLIKLFKQMTQEEINSIKVMKYDELWNLCWSEDKIKPIYHSEYQQSKYKFEKLLVAENGLDLKFYTDNVKPDWMEPEWGFPKGRRNMRENNKECAVREFREEANYNNDDYIILDSIEPISEELIGTNGVSYKHIYYVGVSTTDKDPVVDNENAEQRHEIGNIGLYTIEDAIRLIRTYHVSKKSILTQLYFHLMNNIIKIVK